MLVIKKHSEYYYETLQQKFEKYYSLIQSLEFIKIFCYIILTLLKGKLQWKLEHL